VLAETMMAAAEEETLRKATPVKAAMMVAA